MKEEWLALAYRTYRERTAESLGLKPMAPERFRARVALFDEICRNGVVFLGPRTTQATWHLSYPPLEIGLVALGLKPFALLAICEHERMGLPGTERLDLNVLSLGSYFRYFLDSKSFGRTGLSTRLQIERTLRERCLTGLGIYDSALVSQILRVSPNQITELLDGFGANLPDQQKLFGYPQPPGDHHFNVRLMISCKYTKLQLYYGCKIYDPRLIALDYLAAYAHAVALLAEVINPSWFWKVEVDVEARIREGCGNMVMKPVAGVTIHRTGDFKAFEWVERTFGQ